MAAPSVPAESRPVLKAENRPVFRIDANEYGRSLLSRISGQSMRKLQHDCPENLDHPTVSTTPASIRPRSPRDYLEMVDRILAVYGGGYGDSYRQLDAHSCQFIFGGTGNLVDEDDFYLHYCQSYLLSSGDTGTGNLVDEDDFDRRYCQRYQLNSGGTDNLDNPMISEVPASVTSIMTPAVTAHLEKLGYLKPIDGGGHHDIRSFLSAVKRYQLNHDLDHPPTASMMLSRLCGVPDIVDGMNLTRLHGSGASCFTLHSGGVRKWDRFHLFYKFESNFFDKAKPSFRLALEEWARHSNFTFTERLGEGPVDILVGFYSGKHRGKHGDCVPFNGPGGAVGHCSNLPDVRVHFDKIQEWSFFNHNGRFVDMETASLHEMGHALGLSHSSDMNSVMFCGITTCQMRRRLTTGDIEALQSLYS